MMIEKLSLIFCGPIIRRLTPQGGVFWWVSPEPVEGEFRCWAGAEQDLLFSCPVDGSSTTRIPVGKSAWVHLFAPRFNGRLPENEKIGYTLMLNQSGKQFDIRDELPHLLYEGESGLSFVIKMKVNVLLHGSCRNPHHASDDSFIGADKVIRDSLSRTENRPALLMLTGDQIYADDVAGPMLHAIHQVICLLGLYDETFEQAGVTDSLALYSDPQTYYQRKEILPKTRVGRKWYFRGGLHPVFTSFFAHNHLISFAEYLAMYLLAWSPELWKQITLDPACVAQQFKAAYDDEAERIQAFVRALPTVARVLAGMLAS